MRCGLAFFRGSAASALTAFCTEDAAVRHEHDCAKWLYESESGLPQ